MGSIKMSERDLDALRAGITEQAEREVRQQLWEEDLGRERGKRLVRHARVILASDLMRGDVICSTRGVRLFKEEGVVVDILDTHDGHPIAGDIWVVTESQGVALWNYDPVLVEAKEDG